MVENAEHSQRHKSSARKAKERQIYFAPFMIHEAVLAIAELVK